MWVQAQAPHLRIAHAFSGLISPALEHGLDLQSGASGRTRDAVAHLIEAAQRLARPVDADVAEEPVLDRVPL